MDFKSGEYSPQGKVRFDCYRIAKDHQKLADKLCALAYGEDRGSKYFWEIPARTLLYSANRIPEISDDIVNIDNAMKWGYAWEIGIFESWDAIGVTKSIKRMKEENKQIPKWITEMLADGHTSFYTRLEGFNCYWDVN